MIQAYTYVNADSVWTWGAQKPLQFPIYTIIQWAKFLYDPLTLTKTGIIYLYDSLGINLFYFRYWVVPYEIEAGYISENQYYNLLVWNATWATTSLSVEKFSLPDVYIIGEMPDKLTPLQHIQRQIKVPAEGVPSISGFFRYNFTDGTIDQNCSGVRVETLPLIEFLDESYSFSIKYLGAIATNMNMKEQRKLVIDRPVRKISGRALFHKLDTKFFNMLYNSGGRFFAIPIIHEKMTQRDSNLKGLTYIYVNEDISLYSELYRSGYIALINKETLFTETKEIESIDQTLKLITLKRPIENDFLWGKSSIYPVMIVKIEELGNTYRTYDTVYIDTSLSEVIS